MRQAQKKREKDKVQVALILAFCVIALTSIFTIKSNIDKINGSNTNLPVSEKVHTEEAGKNAAVQKIPRIRMLLPHASRLWKAAKPNPAVPAKVQHL